MGKGEEEILEINSKFGFLFLLAGRGRCLFRFFCRGCWLWREVCKLRCCQEEGMAFMFTYLYDAGEGWEHEITLEEIVPPTAKLTHPILLSVGYVIWLGLHASLFYKSTLT